MSRKRRKKKLNRNLSIVLIFAVLVCGGLGVKTVELKRQQVELAERHDALQKQMSVEQQRTKELEELEKYMQTKKFVEEVAKEKLGLVYPDEILIQPDNK